MELFYIRLMQDVSLLAQLVS